MKRNITLLVLALCFIVPSMHATKRALVIGVGAYPESTGWKAINGDKDIPVVTAMLNDNGFQSQDIVTLKNEQATCARITSEMKSLVAKCNTGDFVFIHFSGHGQQITDLDGDEDDGLDEAWVPYDACLTYQKGKYEGQNHLLDDQLNVWLSEMRRKVGDNGKIVVVADACHSGGSTRAVGDEEEQGWVARGTSDTFIIPGSHTAYNGASQQAGDWVLISACKSNETNYEYKGTGSLTYALSQLKGDLTNLTNKQIRIKAKGIICQIIPFNQNPQIDCPDTRKDVTFF